MLRRCALSRLVVAVTAVCFVGAALGQQKITEVAVVGTPLPLPADSRIRLVVPETGHAVVCTKDGVGVTVWRKLPVDSTEPSKTVDLGGAKLVGAAGGKVSGKPVVLLADDRDNITVVDPESGVKHSVIAVAGPLLSIAAPMTGELGLVYYSVKSKGGRESLEGDSQFGRVDVRTGKDLGRYEPKRDKWRHEHQDLLVVAVGEGGHLYTTRRQDFSSGVLTFQVGEATGEVSYVGERHDASEACLPSELGTVYGRGLWDASLRRRVLELPENARAMLPGTPFVVGFVQDNSEEGSLAVMSLNTGKAAMSVKVAAPGDSAQRNEASFEPQSMSYRGRIFVDPVNQRLVLTRGNRPVAVAIASLGLPDEPVLGWRMDGSTRPKAGAEWTARVTPLDPKTSVTLSTGPEDMKFVAGTLTWRPDIADVGVAQAELSVTGGGVTVKRAIELTVTASEIALPFDPDRFDVSEDGTRIALVQNARDQYGQGGGGSKSRLALVDVDTGQVLLDKRTDYAIAAVSVAGDGALAADQNADAVHYSPIKGEGRTIYTKGRVRGVATAGDRAYIQAERALAVHSIPQFALVSESADRFGGMNPMASVPVRHEDGWLTGGTVWSGDFKERRLLVWTPWQPVASAKDDQHQNFYDPSSRPETRWGVSVQGNSLVRSGGQTILQVSEGRGCRVLRDYPVALFVVTSQRQLESQDPQQGSLREVSLNIVELATAKSRKLSIRSTRGRDDGYYRHDEFGGSRSPIFDRKGGVGVIDQDRVILLTAAELGIENAPMPLRFEPRQSCLVAPADQPFKLTYKVSGGKPPLAFSLGLAAQGIEIDKGNGEVTIDPSKLEVSRVITQLAHQAAGLSMHEAGGLPQAQPPPEKADWAKVLSENQQSPEDVLPGEIKGAPAVVALTVKVRDSDQQEAALSHQVVLDIPLAMLDAAYATRRAEVVKMLERHKEMQRQAEIQSPQGLEEQIKQLRLENERLKAQIELLKQMLKDAGLGQKPEKEDAKP